jgi:hypothetical protein
MLVLPESQHDTCKQLDLDTELGQGLVWLDCIWKQTELDPLKLSHLTNGVACDFGCHICKKKNSIVVILLLSILVGTLKNDVIKVPFIKPMN